MKITAAEVTNFGSYSHLELSFDTDGLHLISGPTGSGKSTLCDIIPWVLFGRTSKNGTVDEVRRWGASDATTGTVTLDSDATITRIRGKTNDLWMGLPDGSVIRGKDLTDTQRIIDRNLGFGIDTYLAGSYFHEFSQTAQFFTANAKSRRSLVEQIVDLTFVKKLQENLSTEVKKLKTEILTTQSEYQRAKDNQDLVVASIKNYRSMSKTFKQDRDNELAILGPKISRLELKLSTKPDYTSEIEVLETKIKHAESTEKCRECGSPKKHIEMGKWVKQLHEIKTNLADYTNWEANLADLEEQADKVMKRVNNYDILIQQAEAKLKKLNTTISMGKLDELKLNLSDLEVLSDVADQYRTLSIQNTITQLQDMTNQYLHDYFDSEITVEFEAVGNTDKLDIQLCKDGNLCTYTQLSKGQRCLLKLCFGVSVMCAVGNHHGVNFSQVWFDEALDGLSPEFKNKAFKLLQNLPYQSIFIVEHHAPSEINFSNVLKVRLHDSGSRL